MSLVNEALKRAHSQAALQQAASNPLSHLAAPAHYSEPKKAYGPLVLIGILACTFVGLLSAAVVHLTKNPPPPKVSVASVNAERPGAVATAPPIQPRVSLTPPPAAATERVTPSREPVAAAADYEPKASAAPPSPSSPNLVEGKVYIQALDFPDVPKVRLDGILWSDKSPAALINGILVAPGDDFGGVTLVGIEPKRVKLEAQSKQFFVRLP